ncbi:MAG: hypothetical protein HFP77_00450, partial [Methylococcales symbiont of Iophon sp. n. MRB-2018]
MRGTHPTSKVIPRISVGCVCPPRMVEMQIRRVRSTHQIRKVRLTARDGGNAVRLSGTISADRQGWWKCSKIVWNN